MNYNLLLHFNDTIIGGTGDVSSGLSIQGTAPTLVDSGTSFGKCANFIGTGGIYGNNVIDFEQDCTFSMRTYISSNSPSGILAMLNSSQSHNSGLYFGIISGSSITCYGYAKDGSTPLNNTPIETVANVTDKWVHWELDWVKSINTLYIFRDGSLIKTTVFPNGIQKTTDYFSIGYSSYWGYANNVKIDECMVINGTALHTSNFTPPTAPYSINYIAYLTNDDKLYGKVNGTFTKLSDSYSGMSTADVKTAILSTTQHASLIDLQTIGVFKGLSYDDTNSIPSSAMTVINNDTILTPIELISLKSIEGIDKVSVNKSISGTGACRLAVTTDLATYKTFNGTEFVNIDISNISTFKTSGITPEVLSTIIREQWDTLTTGKTGIGFAYLPTIEESTDICNIVDINLTVDMKGTWKKAIHGTNFDYDYPQNDILRVSISTEGSYKINYKE